MKIKHNAEVPLNDVTMEGAAGCKVRWLVGEADAAPNFAMRQFELEPGGHTPRHFHPYEHEIFVLEGEGVAVLPEYLVAPDLKAKRLVRIFPGKTLAHDYFRLIFRADDPRKSLFHAIAKSMLRKPLK